MEGETLFSFLALTSEFSSFDLFSDKIFATLSRRTKRAVSWSELLRIASAIRAVRLKRRALALRKKATSTDFAL